MNIKPLVATAQSATSVEFSALPPLSLYIHLPWCIKKCPYCDFNSHVAREALPETAYVNALLADLEANLPQVWGRPVHTIFIGGGTPSLFSVEAITQLLAGVRARLPLLAGAEVTLEANPGTAEAVKFAGYRAAGVNRLSLGIQSFNDDHLKALGRVHDATQSRQAIELAMMHFDRVNLDVMYGLPQQTVAQALQDIAIARSYAPEHLSAYHLTLEPNTYFHRYPPVLPDDDCAADMQEAIEADLAQDGYVHYETSAFARPQAQCQHNLNYWMFGDYLGIGAGAHGKLSFKNRILRTSQGRQPSAYVRQQQGGSVVSQSQAIAIEALPGEFMMNALRLNQGWDLGLFAERTGLNVVQILDGLSQAQTRGFIERHHQRIVPTQLGQRFLNDLVQLFLAEE